MGEGGLPRVLLLATGGTISMRQDAAAGGAVPRLSGREILDSVPGVDEVAELEVREFGRFPGPHMTIERMWELRAAVLEALAAGFQGVVIMHGTDTIEETAYLLDRSLPADLPVVITGAMRNSSELSWDGPANLMSAVEVAASPESRGRGTMVVMDEEIVQGAEVGEAGMERKRRMLTDKNLDLVVYNDVSVPGIGFDASENEVTLLTQAGERELPRASKEEIAAGIVDEVERLLQERRGSS